MCANLAGKSRRLFISENHGPLAGRCMCGDVRYFCEGEVLWSCICHCEDCRRQTASPFTAFFGVPSASFRWHGKTPSVYHSSPGVNRYFCSRCGTPMAFESARWPGETHFYIATLTGDHSIRPQRHVYWAEHLDWAEPADDLPRDLKSAETPT